MKLNLSRAASKMAQTEPKRSTPSKLTKQAATPKPAPERPAAELAPEPTVNVEPAVLPPPAAPAPAAKKSWPVKSKRPRFVRTKAEKRDRRAASPLPPPSTSVFARLMTRNLSLPPKTEDASFLR